VWHLCARLQCWALTVVCVRVCACACVCDRVCVCACVRVCNVCVSVGCDCDLQMAKAHGEQLKQLPQTGKYIKSRYVCAARHALVAVCEWCVCACV
jgi:hypothetical protein